MSSFLVSQKTLQSPVVNVACWHIQCEKCWLLSLVRKCLNKDVSNFPKKLFLFCSFLGLQQELQPLRDEVSALRPQEGLPVMPRLPKDIDYTNFTRPHSILKLCLALPLEKIIYPNCPLIASQKCLADQGPLRILRCQIPPTQNLE